MRVGRFPDGCVAFEYCDGVRFGVEQHGREIWGDWPSEYSFEDACTYLVGPVMAYALRLQGRVCLHASCVAIGDRAVALMGEPGAGKSTTAARFAQAGFPVLSDDVVVLEDCGNEFPVQPGYPRVNLWPPSVRLLFGDEQALPHITPTWGKHYLQLDQRKYRFQTDPVPLAAIYWLGDRDASLESPVIERLSSRDAFMAVVANSYVNYLLDSEMRKREFDLLSRLVAALPVRRVRPCADPAKVGELCESIAADLRETKTTVITAASHSV